MTNLPTVPPGRHRRHRSPRASGLITLLFVLTVAGLGVAGASSQHTWGPAGPEAAQRGPGDTAAALAVAALQRRYGASSYVATRSWQSANALGATIDYMLASGSREFLADLSRTYRAHHDRDGFRNSYYDDEGWWALTWIDAYDLTGNSTYLSQARQIFTDMTRGWDSTCSGGIWWSKARRYKNAIANELFLQVAAALHIRTPGDTAFAAWAAREWAWFRGTGMLTASHLVVDGLADCKPVLSSPTWTYNQGVLIGGLVSLAQITGQSSLLATAEQTADAVVGSSALSPGGILRDPCEPSSCGLDEPLFKGIFMKNLRQLSDRLGGSYQPYLRHNALAVWSDDRRGDEFGLLWGGPFDAASTARQTSALDVLNTQVTGSAPAGQGG